MSVCTERRCVVSYGYHYCTLSNAKDGEGLLYHSAIIECAEEIRDEASYKLQIAGIRSRLGVDRLSVLSFTKLWDDKKGGA